VASQIWDIKEQKTFFAPRTQISARELDLPNFVSGLLNRFCINWASKAKQVQSNTMTIDSNIIDTTGVPRPKTAAPVLSIALESMVMVLDCPCLALEAQLIQNLLNKPLTKLSRFGSGTDGLGWNLVQTGPYRSK